MSVCLYLYSGDSLYFSNSTSHSASVVGGFRPNNFQSTILKPDSVSRVTPPKTTAPNAIPAIPPIHHPTNLKVNIHLK